MGQQEEKNQAVKPVTCLKSGRDIRQNPHTVGAFQNMEEKCTKYYLWNWYGICILMHLIRRSWHIFQRMKNCFKYSEKLIYWTMKICILGEHMHEFMKIFCSEKSALNIEFLLLCSSRKVTKWWQGGSRDFKNSNHPENTCSSPYLACPTANMPSLDFHKFWSKPCFEISSLCMDQEWKWKK